MKKILEYLYIFSKLSTSFILLLCIFVIGYFFYISFKKQENTNNYQLDLFDKLNENTEKISEIAKKISVTESILDNIRSEIQISQNSNNSDEIVLLNKKINEINLKLENISINLEKIESAKELKLSDKRYDNQSIVLEENKNELSKLIILKFENNLDYSDELNILENLNLENKKYIFEKINLIKLKNYRGNVFIRNVFSKELDFFLKNNFNNNTNNFITKSLMNFIQIKPSKSNIIKNNDINKLKEINGFIEDKKYKISYETITGIKNYQKYFSESVDQIQIAIEFRELIKEVG